jgi:zinc protease
MKALFILCLVFVFSPIYGSKSFDIKRWKTANGAHVVFYQAMEVPMLDINVAFAAGSAYDGDSFGLSALTTRLLNQGNSGLDATTIAEKLEITGAQYQAETARDMVVFNLKSLTAPAALQGAVDVFASIIAHPDFPEAAFKREKNQQLIAISEAEDTPDEIATLTFFKALYQKHPYAHPINGDRDQINQLSAQQVRDFYQQFYGSENAYVVLVGAIDEPKAHKIAEQLTKDLPRGQYAGAVPTAFPLQEEMNIGVKYPSSQTVIRLGQLGIDHHDKNYFPLIVGNYSLGGGSLVSRLALEVREKRGLTYGITSEFAPMPGLGPFIISFSTKTNQAETGLDVTRKILTEFMETGPSIDELQAAQQYLTGSFPMSLASNRNIAKTLLKLEFYHLPENYLDTYIDNINKVTTSEIKEAFKQVIKPNHLLQVSVGKM